MVGEDDAVLSRRGRDVVPAEASAAGAVSGGIHATVTEHSVAGILPRARVWLRQNVSDLVISMALAALCVGVLLLRLEGIASGGDAIEKWFFVKQWFYRNDFSHAQWNHHMARVGVNAVSYVVQLLFGRGPGAYYVPSVACIAVQAICLYACGRRLAGRLAGILGATLLAFFPDTIRAGSQLMPEVFSGTYAIVATYFYLRYTDAAGSARRGWFIAMSLALVCDYLAKETSVFFFPGFAVALFLAGTSFRDRALAVARFGGIFLFAVLCESAFYRIHTGYPHRLAVVQVEHVPGPETILPNLWALFRRYTLAVPRWQVVNYAAPPVALGVVVLGRNFRGAAIVAITASYYFFLTFLVRHLHPITLWQNFLDRYFDPVAPFLWLLAGLFVSLSVRRVLALLPSPFARGLELVERYAAFLVVTGSVIALAARYSTDAKVPGKLALVQNRRMAEVANDTYRRNLPFVSKRDSRGMWALYAAFVDDSLLARRRELPAWETVEKKDGDRSWLVRDPRKYDLNILHRMIRRHCYVEVKAAWGRGITMRPLAPLGRGCEAELARAQVAPDL